MRNWRRQPLIIFVVGDESNKRARIYVNGGWRPELDDTDRKHLSGQETVIHE